MEPTKELADQLYRERVLRARRMSIEEKSWLGAQLFEEVCERMADGLRNEHPEADEAQIRHLLRERLRRLRQVRETS